MTEWQIPHEFPDLSTAKAICVDVETRDPDLKSKGPGVRRGGYIVGVAIGTNDGFRAYYPVAHDEGPNLNKEAVFRWLSKQLANPAQAKVGANLLYDSDYLAHQGIGLAGRWLDVICAEPLIDENARGSYSLDKIAAKYVQDHKLSSDLELACAQRGYTGPARSNIWKLPATLVGAYAEKDVDLPLRIWEKQRAILKEENLLDLFKLEMRLLPVLLHMRRVGVRIHRGNLEQLTHRVAQEVELVTSELQKLAGRYINYWSAKDIATVFDAVGETYPRTPTGLPSFTKEFLASSPNRAAKLVSRCRILDKMLSTFLKGQIGDSMIGDRIHCMFNSSKSDEHGTVTGRFSSSNPNMQFIPARDKELGPLCRALFIPEEDCVWGRADESQVEFRIFAHYAQGDGADAFREAYNDNPNIDFHQACADLAGVSRTLAKTINFGLLYGMGLAKTAATIGLSANEAKAFLEKYNSTLPFARGTLREASERAQRRGYVRTILGRRRRFQLWEPVDWDLSRGFSASTEEVARAYVAEARKRAQQNGLAEPVPGIRRAGTHKALNAVVQGSAADLMKAAMVQCWEAGLFTVLVPHLTVHDELDVSIPRTPAGREAWKELLHIMTHAITFKVPLAVSAATGTNWAEAK